MSPHPMRATLDRAHAAAQVRRFAIDVQSPDGKVDRIERTGTHTWTGWEEVLGLGIGADGTVIRVTSRRVVEVA